MKPAHLLPKLIFCFSAALLFGDAHGQDFFQSQRDLSTATLFGRSTFQRSAQTIRDERPSTGDTGLWALEMSAFTSYDTNAFQNATELDDWHVDSDARLSYDLWPNDSFAISTFGSIGFSRYDRFSALDGENLGAGIAIVPSEFPLTLSYASKWFYTKSFDDNNFTMQILKLESKFWEHKADNSVCFLKATGQRNFTNPSSNDAFQFGLIGGNGLKFTDQLSLETTASIIYRTYDDFGGIDRNFWLANVGSALKYTINDQAYANLGVSYYHNADTLPTADFDRFVVFAGLTLNFEKAMSLFGYKAPADDAGGKEYVVEK